MGSQHGCPVSQEKRLVRSATDSVSRVAEARSDVAGGINTDRLRSQVDRLSKPRSPSSAMKKAGVALIVGTPDPITAVPGVALIAASYVSKRRDPAKLDDLAAEARKVLREIESLRL
jgi:hypothetical protein